MTPQMFGIRRYFSLLTLLPLLVMAVCLESYFLVDRYKDLNQDLLLRGQSLSRQLAASSEFGVFTNNQDHLRDLAASTLRESDVKAVYIFKETSILIAAGDVKSSKLKDLLRVNLNNRIVNDGRSIWIYEPILSTQILLDEMALESVPVQVGAILVEMSWQKTIELKAKLLITSIFGTLLIFVITAYVTHKASRRIIEPIQKLSEAVDAIAAGDLTTQVNAQNCIKELCTLTDGVNVMATELFKDRLDLQNKIDQATEQLRQLAFYDPLTHLPNRRLLQDRLANAFAVSKRSERYGALMFLDLDNFKPLNDQYGHAVGDLLLIESARRITACLREIDTVARFGGDEFVVMLNELDLDERKSIEIARLIAEKILSVLSAPYELVYQPEGKPADIITHSCTASIGVNLFQSCSTSPEDALAGADGAMYLAKQQGRNSIHFNTRK